MRTGRFSVGKGGILLPMDEGGKALTVNVGEVIDVEEVYARDMVFHRRLFATIGELAEASGQTDRWMRAQLLVYTGLFDVLGTLDGKHVVAVKSMSRRSMTDEALHKFWDKAKQPIATKVLPLIPNETTREHLAYAITQF